MYSQATVPTPWGAFALLRCVLLRERITIVHGHQAFSAMAHQALSHARTLGYKVQPTFRVVNLNTKSITESA